MKLLYTLLCVNLCIFSLNDCSSKKQPVGNFQSVECRTICNNNQCTQQCIGASGDYYKK